MRLDLVAIGAAIVLMLIGGAFWLGVDHGRDLQRAADLKNVQRAAEAAQRIIRAAWTFDQRLADDQVVQRTKFREIIREVPTVIDRPVYRNICIDADGVRLLERAVAAANGDAIGRADDDAPEGRPTADRP